MFEKSVYSERRKRLINAVGSGIILFVGNNESPINYTDNAYPFRQDSTFLYYFGFNQAGLAGLIDVDENREILFGKDPTVQDLIWTGPKPSLSALARKISVRFTKDTDFLKAAVEEKIRSGRQLHYLPPYRAETAAQISKITGIKVESLNHYASVPLIKAVSHQRIIKTDAEIREIEIALDLSYKMYMDILKGIRPASHERDVVAIIESISASYGSRTSFPTIATVHGETLHNPHHGNRLQKGRLLLIDAGLESPELYASDITRTFPVSGRFTSMQKEIYEIVLEAQNTVIRSIKPGITYRSVHMKAARKIASGLKSAGILKGDINDAVRNGAHALFFHCGIGHLLGLDVHDMENLGEDLVGYDDTIKRSKQFGLSALRFAKPLKPGMVLTVEPGIYFIPKLMDQWKAEKICDRFINYPLLEKYKSFGGIRIEDDVMVTKNGCRLLGKPIPKTVDDIETIMGG